MKRPLIYRGGNMPESKARFATVVVPVVWAVLTLMCQPAAIAQTVKDPLRIGILVAASVEQRGQLETALAAGLRQQGYVEGKNLVIERRYTNGVATLLPEYAHQLADLKLDAIVTTCTDSTRNAKEATSSTPIVMAAVADPVGQHLIASLSSSGNNITGLSSQAEDILAKRLEMIAMILPESVPVAVLTNANNPVHKLMWPTLASAAKQLKLRLVPIEV
jgi:putative tryptophan/tyrosine transport system substrate-binding protein